jgi:hypothetical protein
MEEFNVNGNLENNDQGSISIVDALSNEDRENLGLTAYWTKFIGIVGFVMSGLILLLALFMIMGMTAMSSMQGLGASSGIFVILGFVYIGLAIFLFIVAQYNYKAGKSLNAALKNNSDLDLSDGIKNIKSIFRTQGIMTAIVLGIYGVILLLGLLGGVGALLMR